MLSPALVVAILCLYAGALFLVALWVERRAAAGRNVGDHAVVYTLSLGVWLTGWTFYGHVGRAASSGLMSLTPHLGATLSIALWWVVVRRMIRIRHAYRITSIADLVSLRYDRSATVAALATVIAVVGVVPYVALQLKAISTTFAIIAGAPAPEAAGAGNGHVGWFVAGFMILFTIVFGVRRIVPTERHQGMVVTMAAETVVKVVAFLAVGIFVTFHLFGGFGDVFQRFTASVPRLGIETRPAGTFAPWVASLVMAMSAVMFVPALFHVMVVENFRERHLRTSLWLFPLCMLVINLFILPIAMGGLLLGGRVEDADRFVLTIPFQAGHPWLSLFVFIGGFSSAMGMTVVNAVTLSTMVTNHLLLPVIAAARALAPLKRYLLQCRWLAVAGVILAALWFERRVGQSAMLATLGGYAFIAILQLAPTIVGGLFWRKGNQAGALLGMGAGFAVWLYTLIVPAFAREGWLGQELLERGPLGIRALRPEHLFGSALDGTSHAVLWSLVLNVGLYVAGSIAFRQSEDERIVSERIVGGLEPEPPLVRPVVADAVIARAEKEAQIEALFGEYFPRGRSIAMTRRCVSRLGIDGRPRLSVIELAELTGEVERDLASSIGAAAAHSAVRRAPIFAAHEQRELKQAYAELIAGLHLPPSDLAKKIDYYRERERLLTAQAVAMQATLRQRDREIADRKLAQAALAEEEARYRSLFDGMPTGLFRTTPAGEIVDINPAFVAMMGYPGRESLLSKRAPDVYIDPEDRKRWQTALERDGVLRDFETQMRRGDGTVIWVRMSSRAVRDAEGRVRHYEGTLEDISDGKRAEEERARLEEQLRQSQKMETVGLLAGGVAHDFNNLLTPILGYTELLLEGLPAGDPRREDLADVRRAAEHARDLTQRLLAFSRKQVLELKTLALGDIIRPFEAMLRRTIRENVRIELALSSRAPVRADSRQLEQVLVNLSINAQDAMPEGGTLRIETSDVELDASFCARHPEVAPGGYVMLAVADTGAGMDPETVPHIFEPFFTTKELGKGTGLGLSTVYGIVKQHGGSIAVESEPGRGTVFKVFLPRAPGADAAAEAQGTGPAAVAHGIETIMVVEDDEMVRTLTRRMLESLGYRVLPAETPDRCLELVRGHAGRIDLLVTDLVLPSMNGMDLFKALHTTRPELKVLFMSGYTKDVIGHRRVLDEGMRFIQKPFSMSSLSYAVRHALDS